MGHFTENLLKRSVLVAFVILFAATVFAQTPATTLKTQSNLVLVPTVVHDKSGAHIPNLTQEDFRLYEDGHERKIAVFEEVRPGNQKMKRPQTAPGAFTNIFSGQSQPNRVTIIAIDTILTPELRQITARDHLLKVLAQNIQADSMVALVLITTTGTRVVHDLTTDPQVLITALKTVVGSPRIARDTRSIADQEPSLFAFQDNPLSPSWAVKNELLELDQFYRGEFERKAQELERRIAIDEDMDALEQIGHSLRGLPGRKSLIWVGGGFPYTVSGGSLGVGLPGDSHPPKGYVIQNPVIARPDPTAQIRLMLPTYERVWKVMNDANIAIYAIDIRGLKTEGNDASIRLENPNEQQRQHWMELDTRDTFRIFAEVTGGDYYTNTNDFDKAYRESMNDSAAYYMLGYYVDRKKDKPGWHELSVKVSRAGANVRSRNGFVLRNVADNELTQQELEVALRSPMDYTGLPIAGRWTAITGKAEKRKVSFSLLLPPGMSVIDESAQNHLDLSFYVRGQDKDGKTVAHSAQEMEGHLTDDTVAKARQEGVRYENSFELAPGEYTVHFVVRDKLTARIGSVTTPLKVATVATAAAK